jgi:hypothetical protein
MASLNSLQMRALAAQTTSLRVLEDGPVALRIKHVASNAVTSVVVTSATNIVLTDADGAATFAFATYSTLGKLADAINGHANWDCKILDGLRATLTTASNLVGGTLTPSTVLDEFGYSVQLDTTTTFTFPIRATYDRTVGAGIPFAGHRVKIVSFEYVMDVGTAAADKVRIYECDPITRTDLQIWSAPSVDSTSTVTSFDFSKAPLTAKEGNDLVVLVTDAASITDATTNYLQVVYTRE